MSLPVDFITVGEQRIQKELLAGAFFQGVTVLTNANGDLAAKIDETIASLKLAVVLRIAEGPIPQPGTSEPWQLFIVVNENPIINRAEPFDGKTARLVVQKIIARAPQCGINLEKATEILGADGIVWQLVGTVEIAAPSETTPV